jgi:hypothetical protein
MYDRFNSKRNVRKDDVIAAISPVIFLRIKMRLPKLIKTMEALIFSVM